jgi:hypothetical protein
MINKITALIILALFLSCHEPAITNEKDTDFVLKLVLIKDEKSKDCHSTHYTIKIFDQHVLYELKGDGFRNEREKKLSYAMKEEDLIKLMRYIKEKNLNRNITERKPTGNMGLSVFLDLEIILNNVKTKVYISGMYNDWETRGGNKRTNIDNLDYYLKAEQLVTAVDGKLKSL